MENLKHKNYIDEAKLLLNIIDENTVRQKDYAFHQSMKATVKVGGYVSEKAIFWLRDIKNRQLEED